MWGELAERASLPESGSSGRDLDRRAPSHDHARQVPYAECARRAGYILSTAVSTGLTPVYPPPLFISILSFSSFLSRFPTLLPFSLACLPSSASFTHLFRSLPPLSPTSHSSHISWTYCYNVFLGFSLRISSWFPFFNLFLQVPSTSWQNLLYYPAHQFWKKNCRNADAACS